MLFKILRTFSGSKNESQAVIKPQRLWLFLLWEPACFSCIIILFLGPVTSEEARSSLFDNFVNFSPPFNILSRRLKAVHTLCHYLQQPVAYCNGSLQSREDVFEFIIAAESVSNLPLERGSARGAAVCGHPH